MPEYYQDKLDDRVEDMEDRLGTAEYGLEEVTQEVEKHDVRLANVEDASRQLTDIIHLILSKNQQRDESYKELVENQNYLFEQLRSAEETVKLLLTRVTKLEPNLYRLDQLEKAIRTTNDNDDALAAATAGLSLTRRRSEDDGDSDGPQTSRASRRVCRRV